MTFWTEDWRKELTNLPPVSPWGRRAPPRHPRPRPPLPPPQPLPRARPWTRSWTRSPPVPCQYLITYLHKVLDALSTKSRCNQSMTGSMTHNALLEKSRT